MNFRNSAERYGFIAIALHWLMAVLVVVAWALGQGNDYFPQGAPRDTSLFVHMTTGLAIIALVALRLGWLFFDRPPAPEPHQMGWIGDWSVTLTHASLYGLMIVVPLLGIAVQFARGRGLPVFGLFEIASPWIRDRVFSRSMTELHELAANGLLVLAAIHALAAVTHHWYWRDNTLRRMLPGAG